MKTSPAILMMAFVSASASLHAADPILVADFEGIDYGDWKVEGAAFGKGPVPGNIRGQMPIEGFLGKGLASSYEGGDNALGKLTSPAFKIERKFITFLIGGGGWANETCMNLLVDGKVVRTATGPNTQPGGSERLAPATWDVAEFAGRDASIVIVDARKGGWGHINVDHIVQTDEKPQSVDAAAAAPEKQPDYTSKVPKFQFGHTLQEQEAQLQSNPLMQRFAESRQQLANDPLRPIYHFACPEGSMNDPNGLCFWQGRWHLFYQSSPQEDRRLHWGHAVSDDLIHWRDLPYAIYPNPEKDCFSGATFVEDGRVIAMYHGTEVGSMVAVSDDPLLLNWEKIAGKAVIPIAKPGEPPLPYRVFDPCIWKKDGMYYALTAGQSEQRRAEFLHRSKDLATWEYIHPFLENDYCGVVGDDGACPYFWPIGDKYILAHFSHMSGAKYMLGIYDKQRDKFVVTDGGNFNFGAFGPSGVHAPSAYPDGKGGVNIIFNMNEGAPSKGWGRIMTLPRRLTLRQGSVFNPLTIEPAGDIESLRDKHVQVGPMNLLANLDTVLEQVQGDALEIIAEVAPQPGQNLEFNLLRSPGGEEVTRILCFRDRGFRRGKAPLPCVVSLDTSRSSLAPNVTCRPPETAQVELASDEPLKLRVFVDRSVVEVFINNRQCLAARVYPERRDSTGVSLRAQGRDATLSSLEAWSLRPATAK